MMAHAISRFREALISVPSAFGYIGQLARLSDNCRQIKISSTWAMTILGFLGVGSWRVDADRIYRLWPGQRRKSSALASTAGRLRQASRSMCVAIAALNIPTYRIAKRLCAGLTSPPDRGGFYFGANWN